MKKIIYVITMLVCCSCSSTKPVTQLVERVSKDTLYLSNVQYDSIYIMKDKVVDRTSDTVFVKDVSIEYRYKMLKDTVRVVQRDSIPYEVTVIETKEIRRPRTWFDWSSYTALAFCLGWFIIKLFNILKKK